MGFTSRKGYAISTGSMRNLALLGALATLLPLFMLLGCSHAPVQGATCQELDWYEIGRNDGARGVGQTQQREVKVVCEDSDQSLNEALYQNGFDSGVAQFCNPQAAFEQGRLRKKNAGDACPPFFRADYIAGYERGQKYSDLQANQKDLTGKIDALVADIGHASDEARRALLSDQKLKLEEQKRAVDQEIGRLENDKGIYLK